MKSFTSLLNCRVLAALCSIPLLLASASVFADETPAADIAVPAAVATAEPAPPYTSHLI